MTAASMAKVLTVMQMRKVSRANATRPVGEKPSGSTIQFGPPLDACVVTIVVNIVPRVFRIPSEQGSGRTLEWDSFHRRSVDRYGHGWFPVRELSHGVTDEHDGSVLDRHAHRAAICSHRSMNGRAEIAPQETVKVRKRYSEISMERSLVRTRNAIREIWYSDIRYIDSDGRTARIERIQESTGKSGLKSAVSL